MARGQDNDGRVARNEIGPEIRVVDRPSMHQTEIDHPVDHGLSRCRGVSFLDDDLRPWMLLDITGQKRNEQGRAQGLRRRDADRARLFVKIVSNQPQGIVGHCEQLACAACQFFARRSERQDVVPANKQHLPDVVLEHLDLFGDTGLRQVYPFGRPCKAQGLGRRKEDFQLA